MTCTRTVEEAETCSNRYANGSGMMWCSAFNVACIDVQKRDET